MGIIGGTNPCASVSNPQNNSFVDPNTNKITITSSQNVVLNITQSCCNTNYLSWMGNGPFIWQNNACYYGSIPTEPINTCAIDFSTLNYNFTINANNQVVVESISNGSKVNLTEKCCDANFLNPILGTNTYIWSNGFCFVNSIPPPVIPVDCAEASNTLNSYQIDPTTSEVVVYGATLTENCCNNVVLSYIDPQGNFVWLNGKCYLNNEPPPPVIPGDSVTPYCCYNSDIPINIRLTTDNPGLNQQIIQSQTYSSVGNLFDTWVELKATIPPTDSGYTFNLGLEILEGVNCCCNYDIFVDDIKITCSSGITETIYYGKCPGFNLTKVIDNKKSWAYNPGSPEVGTSVYDEIERKDGFLGTIAGEGDINRTFAPSPDAKIKWRYTDYLKQSGVLEKHSKLAINSKELWLTFDMCADCPITGTTQVCPPGFNLETTNGVTYCLTTTGYTISSPNSETLNCYTLSSTTGIYSACTNFSLETDKYYSGEVVISAGTLNQNFIYPKFSNYSVGFSLNSIPNYVEVQPDGKLLVGGTNFLTYNGTFLNYKNIIRLNSNGTLDNTFTYSGINYNQCRAFVTQPDGKIIIGWGQSSTDLNLLQRVNSDGTVDPSFNLLSFNNGGSINTIKLNSDGSMYIGGTFTKISGLNYRKIAKITSGGTIDTSFDTLNKASSIPSFYVDDIDTLSDGTVIAVGNISYVGSTSEGVFFLNPDGTVNSNYPPNTNTIPNLGPPIYPYSGGSIYSQLNSIHVDNDDVYVVGLITYDTTISKIAKIKSGTTQFDSDFALNVGFGFDGQPNDIIMDNEGNLIVTGSFSSFNGTLTPVMVKLDTEGNLIQNFNTNTLGFVNSNNVYHTAITNDNNIIAVGPFTKFNDCDVRYIAKINNSATTISNCFKVINSTPCNSCCSYTAGNLVGPYLDSACSIPFYNSTIVTSPTEIEYVNYLSLFELEQYKKQFQSYWIPFMEQFIPATTIWVAGELWCNDPCPTEVDCGFELTSEDATIQTVSEKSFTPKTGAKSFTSTTPENLKSSASFGSPNGNDANFSNSNENVIITEDVGLVNQNLITKTFAENNIDIQAYRSKFTAYRTQIITI